MIQLYEDMPFGIMIINGSKFVIEYLNKKAQKLLNLNGGIINSNISTLGFLSLYLSVIYSCFIEQKEERIEEVEIGEGRYFTIIICGKKEKIEIFFHETTEQVLTFRKRIESSKLKLEKEKQRFVNISTEYKTKCDIIEILRDREKEHLMHLKDVINNISEGLIVIDNKGKFSICNRSSYKITGLNIGELFSTSALKQKYDIYGTGCENVCLSTVNEDIFKNHLPVKNLVIILKDKETKSIKYIELNSNPIFNRQREILYTIVTLKDVTEAKLHEINAEEQANFVNDVVNTLDVPIAVIDYPEFTYKLANEKYKNLIKSSEDINDTQNIVQTDFDFKIKMGKFDENMINIIRAVGDTGKEFTISPHNIIDEEGNERFFKLKFTPHKDLVGNISRVHLHGLDITDEINHNRELEKVTRLKDEFFTVISHELRTPLTIIYSSLQLAYNIYRQEITPNIDKTLRRIDQNCSRLLKLINNILDISKAEAGFLTVNSSNFDIVYITEFIVSSVNLYAKSKGIDLIFDTNEEECIVCLDKDKYEKIVLNLLSNAIKFTPEGKQIMVTLEIEEEFINLKVEDHGIGIPESKLNYIFDRFAQVNTSLSRRAEGTGIGLSLVKKLVEYMNGDIQVRSEEGKGSEFSIRFNKNSAQFESEIGIAAIDTTIGGKIDIEFSDIN